MLINTQKVKKHKKLNCYFNSKFFWQRFSTIVTSMNWWNKQNSILMRRFAEKSNNVKKSKKDGYTVCYVLNSGLKCQNDEILYYMT